jgi:ParB-like nuclease domain
MAELQLHPLCTLFPRIVGAEFEALKADILANGLRQPIVVHEGMILDGGNRYRACVEIGVAPTTVEFESGNLVSFVLSSNLHRRHLSAGQQAAIVASAQDWASAQSHGGNRKPDQSATLHLDSVAKRAAESGASVRTQKMADKVAKQSPDLAKKVAHGEVSLPQALRQIAPAKPEMDPESEYGEDDGPSDSEIAFLEEMEKAKQSAFYSVAALAESDDKMAAALARIGELEEENARLRAEIRVVKEARDGHMNGKNEAIRMVKSLQRKLGQIEKAAA